MTKRHSALALQFAVRQWDGSLADLDFKCVVRELESFILVGRHVPAIAELTPEQVSARMVPWEAKLTCAFYRVWCLVELHEALAAGKAVVMLVGTNTDGRFAPNTEMLYNLALSIDVQQAHASVDSDRQRILRQIEMGLGHDRLNRMAISAISSCAYFMEKPVMLVRATGEEYVSSALLTLLRHHSGVSGEGDGRDTEISVYV